MELYWCITCLGPFKCNLPVLFQSGVLTGEMHKFTLALITQRNKETEWNNQPLSSLILFENESQKSGQKILKNIEKHNFYLLGHPESPKNLIFYHKICFFYVYLSFLKS